MMCIELRDKPVTNCNRLINKKADNQSVTNCHRLKKQISQLVEICRQLKTRAMKKGCIQIHAEEVLKV